MRKTRSKIPSHADATRCIHSGEERHGRYAPLTTPIEQTAVYALPNVEALRQYAKDHRGKYLYTRYGNPTVAAAEEKIAALEGAEAAVATSSGMAAEMIAALIACKAGDEIVSMLDIYGGTLKLFDQVLPRCGITTKFIPYHDINNAARYFSSKNPPALSGDPNQPNAALRRPGEVVRAGTQAGSLRGGRQHFCHAHPAKAAGTRRRHGDSLRDQVSGRPQRPHGWRAGRVCASGWTRRGR